MFNIEDEYKRNSRLKKEDIEHLKQWKSKQPHLPDIPDETLAHFLHSCYYRLEPTKITIDNYYTIRTHAPELFSNRRYADHGLQEAKKTMHLGALEGRTKEGYAVFFFRLARTEPELYNMVDVIKMQHMFGDLWHTKYGITEGDVIVFDMTGLSFGHVGRFNMSVMRKNLVYLQDGIPTRLQGIHLMNTVSFIDVIMNMLKPFMKSELLSLFHFHQSGSDELYKYVPKDMIPSDCGGTGRPLKELHEEAMKLIKENEDWLSEEETLRVDETKRPGKAKNSGDLFGVEGSFKKLDVD